MRTTFLPPHLTAQTLASQPVSRPQPQAAPTGQDGFEALALKAATPSRVITARPVETRPAEAAAPAASRYPAAGTAQPQPQQSGEIERFQRPGSKLDIRV
jgi:hypothetical protein